MAVTNAFRGIVSVIGDDVIIGANAVVINDVLSRCVLRAGESDLWA